MSSTEAFSSNPKAVAWQHESAHSWKESHRLIVRILMVSVFLAVSYVWIRLSLSKEVGHAQVSLIHHPKAQNR